jgi:protein tyrosine phosphatase (PTP) superfamily phosphohydrolase (DUF442 family)
MDAPARFSRRNLIRYAGAAALLALSAEGLRVFAFTNRHTIIPGKAYRSAQLSPDQLQAEIERHGIRTVINLRGTSPDTTWYDGEATVTHRNNISQEDLSLSAKRLPPPAEVRRMLDVLDHTEWPIIMHCQRGADRTGLVATSVVLLFTNATLAEAKRQLWPRYGHIRGGRTVVIDEFFDFYESWLAGRDHTPALFRDWILNHYCPGPFRAELTRLGEPKPLVERGRGFTLTIRAKNTSVRPWIFHAGPSGGIQLRASLFKTTGEKLYTAFAGLFEGRLNPGESRDFVLGFPPVNEPGQYTIHADLLDSQPIDLHDSDFVQYGSEPLVFEVTAK